MDKSVTWRNRGRDSQRSACWRYRYRHCPIIRTQRTWCISRNFTRRSNFNTPRPVRCAVLPITGPLRFGRLLFQLLDQSVKLTYVVQQPEWTPHASERADTVRSWTSRPGPHPGFVERKTLRVPSDQPTFRIGRGETGRATYNWRYSHRYWFYERWTFNLAHAWQRARGPRTVRQQCAHRGPHAPFTAYVKPTHAVRHCALSPGSTSPGLDWPFVLSSTAGINISPIIQKACPHAPLLRHRRHSFGSIQQNRSGHHVRAGGRHEHSVRGPRGGRTTRPEGRGIQSALTT